MKYLVFLFWIPALVVLYLSIHEEMLSEKKPDARETSRVTAHAGHPH